ncbi:S9 family peptidase [Nitriliruptor alkaliphilus]|uniref:S9 family peptidase n=1 Tax=Nitriliruptor alkaliphilus TaxID=427918 RepID=UPI0006962994|nr:S9 family peptidase [Nitriliruptor alkaliphilus]
MRPDDLRHLVTPSDPRWHLDGRRLAFVVTRVDLDEDRYHHSLHLWDGSDTRALTRGPSDAHPRWAPDGRTLAFLRTSGDEGAHAQIALLPADGGEARLVTELPRGVSGFAWAPDGSRIVLVGDTWIDDLADLDAEERGRRPRRLTRLPYRVEGGGWVHERRRQLWLVDDLDADEPRVRPLTDLRDDVAAPAWTADGGTVLAITRATDVPDTEPHDQIVAIAVPAPSAQDTIGEVSWGPVGSWSWVGVDGRGVRLAAGLSDPFLWPGVARLVEVPDGAGPTTALRDLTGHLDRDVLPGVPGVVPPGPRAVAGGLVTPLEDRGTTRLVHVADPTGDDPPVVTDLFGGARAVSGVDVHPDGRTLAICWTDVDTPGDLLVLRDGVETPVTCLGESFRSAVRLAQTERWTFERDGAEIDAWSVLPDGFDDAEPASVPLLLNIHGGPTSQYGDHFFDEFQVGAGAGYLVVGTNPRGSSGRGTDWARAIVGAWPTAEPVDIADLAAAVDAALARYPQLDRARVGVVGGSYGGYATARLIAADDRYASAIVERGLLEWGSFGGTSDIGPFFDRMFLDASLPDGPAPHHAASPLWTAGDVRTPTLVLHSDADWRCPVEQAERYFAALVTAGVTTEFVRFPDEGHELTRSGTPRHRVERFEIVLDWHARHLGRAPAADGGLGTPL